MLKSKLNRRQKNTVKNLYFDNHVNRWLLDQFSNRKRARVTDLAKIAAETPVAKDDCEKLFQSLQEFGIGHLNGDYFYWHCKMLEFSKAIRRIGSEFGKAA